MRRPKASSSQKVLAEVEKTCGKHASLLAYLPLDDVNAVPYTDLPHLHRFLLRTKIKVGSYPYSSCTNPNESAGMSQATVWGYLEKFPGSGPAPQTRFIASTEDNSTPRLLTLPFILGNVTYEAAFSHVQNKEHLSALLKYYFLKRDLHTSLPLPIIRRFVDQLLEVAQRIKKTSEGVNVEPQPEQPKRAIDLTLSDCKPILADRVFGTSLGVRSSSSSNSSVRQMMTSSASNKDFSTVDDQTETGERLLVELSNKPSYGVFVEPDTVQKRILRQITDYKPKTQDYTQESELIPRADLDPLTTRFFTPYRQFEEQEEKVEGKLQELQVKRAANKEMMNNIAKQAEELRRILNQMETEDQKDMAEELRLMNKKDSLPRGQKRLLDSLPIEYRLLIDIGRKLGSEDGRYKRQKLEPSE